MHREQGAHVRTYVRTCVRALGGGAQGPDDVDEQGWSGLHHAVNASQYSRRAGYAARALAPQSNVNLLTTGTQPPRHSPMHFACSGSDTSLSRVEVVKALIDARAQLEAATPNGTTPLLLAASSGLTDICRVLLAAGADRSAKNKKGKGALELARGSSRTVGSLLGQWGCPETHGENSPSPACPPSWSKQVRYCESRWDMGSSWNRRTRSVRHRRQ